MERPDDAVRVEDERLRHPELTLVLGTLAIDSTLLATALLAGLPLIENVAAYVLLVSAVLAWYVASAMMLEGTFKRVVLPVGTRGTPSRPGTVAHLIQYESGEPGVKTGQ